MPWPLFTCILEVRIPGKGIHCYTDVVTLTSEQENLMLQCPRCDTPNPVTNRYCDRCGDSLFPSNATHHTEAPFQSEYTPHLDYPGFTEPEFENNMASQSLLYQKLIPPRPKLTLFWIVRAILYFIAIFIAAFGLFAAFTSISNNNTIAGLGLFFFFGLMVAGVVFFIRVRHRVQHLRLRPLVGWICGATVGTFMAAILENAFFSDFSKDPVGSFIFGCVVLLYGLIIAGVALW